MRLMRDIAGKAHEVAARGADHLADRPEADLPGQDQGMVQRAGPVTAVHDRGIARPVVPDDRGADKAGPVYLVEVPDDPVRAFLPYGVAGSPDQHRRAVLGEQVRDGNPQGGRDRGQGQHGRIRLPALDSGQRLLRQPGPARQLAQRVAAVSPHGPDVARDKVELVPGRRLTAHGSARIQLNGRPCALTCGPRVAGPRQPSAVNRSSTVVGLARIFCSRPSASSSAKLARLADSPKGDGSSPPTASATPAPGSTPCLRAAAKASYSASASHGRSSSSAVLTVITVNAGTMPERSYCSRSRPAASGNSGATSTDRSPRRLLPAIPASRSPEASRGKRFSALPGTTLAG